MTLHYAVDVNFPSNELPTYFIMALQQNNTQTECCDKTVPFLDCPLSCCFLTFNNGWISEIRKDYRVSVHVTIQQCPNIPMRFRKLNKTKRTETINNTYHQQEHLLNPHPLFYSSSSSVSLYLMIFFFLLLVLEFLLPARKPRLITCLNFSKMLDDMLQKCPCQFYKIASDCHKCVESANLKCKGFRCPHQKT